MNIIDIVIGIVLIFGFYKGYTNGLILEITSLLGLIIGIFGAYFITKNYGLFLGEWFNWEDHYLKIVTFVLSFIAIVIFINIVGKVITKVLDYAALGVVNQIFGGVFGALKVALILSILLMVFNVVNDKTPLIDKTILDTSIFYPYLNEFSDFVWPQLVELTADNQDVLDKIPSLPE